MKKAHVSSKMLLFTAVVVALGLSLVSSNKVDAAEKQGPMIELRYQLYQPPTHVVTVTVRRVTEYVNKIMEGRVKIKVYDSGVLAKAPDLHNAVQRGVVDIATWMPGFATEKNVPFLLLACLPFVYRDTVGFIDAWEKEETLDRLTEEYFAENGYDQVKQFGTFNVGPIMFAFKDKEPKLVNDFKPLKIRASGPWMSLLKQVGGKPVMLPISQTYEALERGILDGSQVAGSLLVDWKLGEPCTYLYDFNFGFGALDFLVNKSSYARLSDLDKDILEAYFRWLRDALNKAYLMHDIIEKPIISSMLKIYTPTAEERDAWEAAGRPFLDRWVDLVGDRGRKALEVIKKYN